jgi:hypothetical protein
MVGKLATILAKKEAEIYRSQGLHKEALTLYEHLLSSSPNLDAGFKAAIKSQIQKIQMELDEHPADENQKLTLAEILRIKKGWGANAAENDLLVCAHAFCQVGHYQYALTEVARLLQKGCSITKVIGIATECMIRLCSPDQIQASVDRFSRKVFKHSPDAHEFQLLLTEEAVKEKQLLHALALYQHLQKDPQGRNETRHHLDAIDYGIRLLQAAQGTEAEKLQKISSEPCDDETSQKAQSRWLSLFNRGFWRRRRK